MPIRIWLTIFKTFAMGTPRSSVMVRYGVSWVQSLSSYIPMLLLYARNTESYCTMLKHDSIVYCHHTIYNSKLLQPIQATNDRFVSGDAIFRTKTYNNREANCHYPANTLSTWVLSTLDYELISAVSLFTIMVKLWSQHGKVITCTEKCGMQLLIHS